MESRVHYAPEPTRGYQQHNQLCINAIWHQTMTTGFCLTDLQWVHDRPGPQKVSTDAADHFEIKYNNNII